MSIYDDMVDWGKRCQRIPLAQMSYGLNPIAGLMQYGKRIGAVNYGQETELDTTFDQIDAIMEVLRETNHKVWASLWTRHIWNVPGREMLGVWENGQIRAHTVQEMAEELADYLGEPKSRARQRLHERCEKGYQIIEAELAEEAMRA